MSELLEGGGVVPLWAGWSIRLPPARHQRNEDGSWSAWGADWSIDVHIIEVSGGANGEAVSPQSMLSNSAAFQRRSTAIDGPSWTGIFETLEEQDNGQAVFRLAGTLCATNTMMSCWVSCLRKEQLTFGQSLLAGAAHESRET